MLNCWQKDANDRPTFEGLGLELKRMENQHKVNSHKPKQTNNTILINSEGATILHWCSLACGRLVEAGHQIT